MRYFRSSAAIYEQVRATLDAAWGYPNAETKTQTAIPPVGELPTDPQGRVYLAISAEYCEYILPSQMLPELIASGVVEEIDAAAYAAVLPWAEAVALLPPDTPEPTAPAASPTLSPALAPSGGGTLAPGVAPSLGGAIVR